MTITPTNRFFKNVYEKIVQLKNSDNKPRQQPNDVNLCQEPEWVEEPTWSSAYKDKYGKPA